MSPTLLLINPAMVGNGSPAQSAPRAAWRRGRLAHAGGAISMEPLALALVAALTPPHWQVRIVDEVVEELPPDLRPDLVAMTSLSITVPRAYELARRYREQGVPVILGGVHATLMPDEVERYVDTVYQGEAEGAWPAVMADFEAGRLQRRYKGDAGPLRNLPHPRRAAYGRTYLVQLLSASRGCRYRCEFCTLWKIESGRYRTRPPAEVLDELQAPARRGPVLFTDENIFSDREWALSLLAEMIRRGVRRPYAVQASMNVAGDDEVLRALKQSGCMTVLIGFESLNEESLRAMRKGVNLRIGVDHYRDSVARLHDHGLAVSGTFIFGYDGDGPDTFARTVEFVQGTGLDLAHFGILTPNPGTDLYDRLAREQRLFYTNFPQDYARYDLRTAVFQPQKMTPQQLEEGLSWAAQAVGSATATVRRAWHTWNATGNLLMTALALGWNRTGMYRRVLQDRGSPPADGDTPEGETRS